MRSLKKKSSHNATEIIPGLWVGDQISAQDKTFFDNYNITVVVNCTKQLPQSFENNNILYMRIPIDDSLQENDINKMARYLPSVVDFIHKNRKRNILIHCHAGMQRSAAVVAAYLHKHYNMPFQKAIQHIVTRRPIAFHWGNHVNFHKALKWYETCVVNKKC